MDEVLNAAFISYKSGDNSLRLPENFEVHLTQSTLDDDAPGDTFIEKKCLAGESRLQDLYKFAKHEDLVYDLYDINPNNPKLIRSSPPGPNVSVVDLKAFVVRIYDQY